METEKIHVLIYGIHHQRTYFFRDVKYGKIELHGYPPLREPSIGAHLIDFYNMRMHHALVGKVKEKECPTLEEWQAFVKELPNLIPDLMENQQWQKYCQCMEWNPKNQLVQLFYKGIGAGLKTEEQLLFYVNEKKEKKYILRHISRGCKNGIDMVRHDLNLMIYFVLDGLNMEKISEKNRNKQYESDYTCKELRYVFRHWTELKEKVVFFENRNIVKAPWIEGKYVHAWQRYHENRNPRDSEKVETKQQLSVEDTRQSVTPVSEKTRETKPLSVLLSEIKDKQHVLPQKKIYADRQSGRCRLAYE